MADDQPKNPIRVVVVDDHPMLREGTATYLAQAADIEVIGVASDGQGAIAMVTRYLPDVLILDVHLPDLSGVEVARITRERFPQVGIVILTGYDVVGHTRTLLQLGVQSYLQKTASGAEIIAAVRGAASGTRPTASSTVADADRDALTSREQDVMRLIDAGLRNAEIAENLQISPKTVEYHISHLLAKLGARSRTEAVLKIRQKNLVSWVMSDGRHS